MEPLEFCENFIRLDRQAIRFDGRPYLAAVYASAGNVVIRASRQVEKSTFVANTILHQAVVHPGSRILLVCPREEQARVFAHSRLLPALTESPVIRRVLLGRSTKKPPVTNLTFRNGSQVYLRAAFRSADAVRGLSADLLLVDEFQDIAPGDLPVLQETLSHAKNGRTILTGTPKLIENHLEAMFSQATGNEWTITCTRCSKPVILDENCLGPNGPWCVGCQNPIDPRLGSWVARNPAATWGDGFWISHLMVPWINYDQIIERQRVYDLPRFKNEVLGLPTTLGDHVVTRAELEGCCLEKPTAASYQDIPLQARQDLVLGIDWGGGGTSRTVLVVGYLRSDFAFEICYLERFRAQEDPKRMIAEIACRCQQFRVRWIAADGDGNGHVMNRLLLNELSNESKIFAIIYSTGQPPQSDGALIKWNVCRSATLGVVFSRIRKKSLLFPRLVECGSFLDEFSCEIVVYDDINRSVKFSHPVTQQDDALHATNYALQTALYIHGKRATNGFYG